MQIIDAAWHDVNTMTICYCWHKAGILPEINSVFSHTAQPSIPISFLLHNPASETDLVAHAEKQVEAALGDLVTTGALQINNQMDIELLLNLVGKSHILTDTSDKEIYHTVMDSITAHKNININGRNNVNRVVHSSHFLAIFASFSVFIFLPFLKNQIQNKSKMI